MSADPRNVKPLAPRFSGLASPEGNFPPACAVNGLQRKRNRAGGALLRISYRPGEKSPYKKGNPVAYPRGNVPVKWKPPNFKIGPLCVRRQTRWLTSGVGVFIFHALSAKRRDHLQPRSAEVLTG